MAQLCKTLKSLSERIVKLHTNTKKDSKSRYTQGYLQTRLETLEAYWSKYQEQHDVILSTVPSSDLEPLGFDVNSLYEETEDVYMEFKGLLMDYLVVFSKGQTQIPSNSSAQSFTTASDCEYTTVRTHLPSLSIPKFSGDYNDWMSFKDLFKALIHDNKHITNIEKHHYLKTSLSGEAEQLLKHFALTGTNYEKAWNTLESRYDNKRMIVTTILSRLLNQKKMSTECSRSLKDILDTTKECLNSLDNLGVDTTTWDAIVVHIVVSKLDLDTHRQWEQSLGSSQDIAKFTLLSSFLESRFRSIEMVNVTHKPNPPQKTHLVKNTTQHKPTNMKSFVTEVNSECTYCKQNHYICHCKDFALLDVPQRQEFIKKNGICFNCLVKGHSLNACQQSTTCKKCHRRHHTLLHFTSPNKNTSEPKHNLQASTTTESSLPTNPVVAMAEAQGSQVILATAQIAVQSRNNDTIILRALIDQASQASFITEAAAQLLDLEHTAVSSKITGISNVTATTKSMVHLKFHAVRDSIHTMTAEAHVLKRLTSDLPSQAFPVDTWPSSERIDLADPHFHKPGSIDVLLGADVHAHIILDGFRRHDSLIALNSRLGWLVSGRVTQLSSHSHSELVMNTQIENDPLPNKSIDCSPNVKPPPLVETQCKQHFKITHTRYTDCVSMDDICKYCKYKLEPHEVCKTYMKKCESLVHKNVDTETDTKDKKAGNSPFTVLQHARLPTESDDSRAKPKKRESQSVEVDFPTTEIQKGDISRSYKMSFNRVKVSILGSEKVYESSVCIKVHDLVKVLGIAWKPQRDVLKTIYLLCHTDNDVITKPTVTCIITKTHDLLCWLAMIELKCLIKSHLANLAWNDELTECLKTEWNTYLYSSEHTKYIQLSRGSETSNANVTAEMYICHASSAACVAVDNNKVITHYEMSLILLKIKKAPDKFVSCSRFELVRQLINYCLFTSE